LEIDILEIDLDPRDDKMRLSNTKRMTDHFDQTNKCRNPDKRQFVEAEAQSRVVEKKFSSID
jgi:hypothetical protein